MLHSAHIGIFPPQTRVLILGNELALLGAVQRKQEAQTFTGTILLFQKTIAQQSRKNLV